MKICFYSIAHIGDIYFSSFFIRRICDMNPEIDFYYYCIQGDVFFYGISNIYRIDKDDSIRNIDDSQYNYHANLMNGNTPEHFFENNTMNFINNRIGRDTPYKLEIYNNEEILFINTWCAAINHIDFNLDSATVAWSYIINKINIEFESNIKYDFSYYNELIYDFKLEDNHIENYDIEYNNTFFIFNYQPRSVSFNFNKLYEYIMTISKTYTVILSSYDDIFDGQSNIKFIDRDFKIFLSPSCSNLVDIWKIAKKCHKVIILPTGSSWIFFHELADLRLGQLFMFDSSYYVSILNTMISLIDPSLHHFIQEL